MCVELMDEILLALLAWTDGGVCVELMDEMAVKYRIHCFQLWLRHAAFDCTTVVRGRGARSSLDIMIR